MIGVFYAPIDSNALLLYPLNATLERRRRAIENQAPPKETVWTALSEARHWYFGIFTLLFIGWEILIIAREIGTGQGIIETCLALLGPSSDAMAFSLGGAYALTEAGRMSVVIAKALDDWRKRRIEAAREVAHKEGEAKGRAEERQAWESWYARWKEARAQGEDFSEPPPNGKI